MAKTVQYFTDDYLEQCKKMGTNQIIEFLEAYKHLRFDPGKLEQINIRIPINVLTAFKAKAEREGMLYQRKIRELMTDWLLS